MRKFEAVVSLDSIEPSFRIWHGDRRHTISFSGEKIGDGEKYDLEIDTLDKDIIEDFTRRMKSLSGMMFRLTLEEVKT